MRRRDNSDRGRGRRGMCEGGGTREGASGGRTENELTPDCMQRRGKQAIDSEATRHAGRPSWERSVTLSILGRAAAVMPPPVMPPPARGRMTEASSPPSDKRTGLSSSEILAEVRQLACLLATLLLFVGRRCSPVARFTDQQDNAPAFLLLCYRWLAAIRSDAWGNMQDAVPPT